MRIYPFDRQQAAPAEQKQKETARFDVAAIDVCPTCGVEMVLATANGHPAWVCVRDRHCFPVKDAQ